jgi:hypothetical protein
MPRFIATHTMSVSEEAIVKMAKEEAPKFSEMGLTWIRTYCDFDNNKFFCEWEAPNKEAIEKLFKETNSPYDDIFPVRLFDVTTAKLED